MFDWKPGGQGRCKCFYGDVPRVVEREVAPYRTYFTTPASTSTLILIMSDNHPSGCGNDFRIRRYYIPRMSEANDAGNNATPKTTHTQTHRPLQSRRPKKLQLHQENVKAGVIKPNARYNFNNNYQLAKQSLENNSARLHDL
jgi:hypothetical protein